MIGSYCMLSLSGLTGRPQQSAYLITGHSFDTSLMTCQRCVCAVAHWVQILAVSCCCCQRQPHTDPPAELPFQSVAANCPVQRNPRIKRCPPLCRVCGHLGHELMELLFRWYSSAIEVRESERLVMVCCADSHLIANVSQYQTRPDTRANPRAPDS